MSLLSTCQRCHQQYNKKLNNDTSCQFHRLTYVCRLHTEGKDYYGVDVGDWDGFCWECCGKQQKNAKPCAQSKHISYDESWTKHDDINAKLIKYNHNKKQNV